MSSSIKKLHSPLVSQMAISKTPKVKRLGFYFEVALQLLMLIIVSGCATAPKPPPAFKIPVMPVAAPVVQSNLAWSAQYAGSLAPSTGFNTFEVYIENRGTNPVTFESAILNGKDLPLPTPVPRLTLPDTIMIDGMPMKLDVIKSPAADLATWWQFYPDRTVEPGQTIQFQINFRATPTVKQRLQLKTASGQVLDLPVQRFRMLEKEITAITYAPEFSKVHIQYTSVNATRPVRVWLNNQPVPSFRLLLPPDPSNPELLVFAPPGSNPLQPGQSLHVKLEFEDHDWRHALVRAMPGIVLDAPKLNNHPDRLEQREFTLDAEPPLVRFGGDFTCSDVKAEDKGGSAPVLVRDRLALYRQDKVCLGAIAYCTAMYPELWNIYGQLADGVYTKPYRLGFGHDPKRFIEEEEEAVAKAWLTARPRPYFYIPESFKSRERLLEADELEVLGWLFMVKGAKGIRYHYCIHPESGFADNKRLQAQIKTLNLELGDVRNLLAPAVFVSEKQISAPCAMARLPASSSTNAATDIKNLEETPLPVRNADCPVKLYTAWAGDKGMIILVRNLDYITDAKADENGEKPRFKAKSRENMLLSVTLPEWLRVGAVRDMITGNLMAADQSKDSFGVRKLSFELDRLDAFKVIWIESR